MDRMSGKVSIAGLDKADVLAALYNAARPQMLGFLDSNERPMTHEQAEMLLIRMGRDLYFDYLQGRVLKVDLSEDEVGSGLYDRDNGEGALAKVVAELRNGNGTNSSVVRDTHASGTLSAAEELRSAYENSGKAPPAVLRVAVSNAEAAVWNETLRNRGEHESTGNGQGRRRRSRR